MVEKGEPACGEKARWTRCRYIGQGERAEPPRNRVVACQPMVPDQPIDIPFFREYLSFLSLSLSIYLSMFVSQCFAWFRSRLSDFVRLVMSERERERERQTFLCLSLRKMSVRLQSSWQGAIQEGMEKKT